MKTAAPSMIDAASVIEFPPGYLPGAARAQVQALFFLAGWREHPAARETMNLTLACIDEPPASVRWLAERAGVRLVELPSRAPEKEGVSDNRARVWEAGGECERLLVLDPEVLTVGDPAPALATLPAGTLLAAAPASKAYVPPAAWPAIYRAVDLPMPTERMKPLRTELGLPTKGEGPDMPPLYHPGAFLAPRASAPGELWTRHAARLAAAWPTLEGLPERHRASRETLERVILATVIQALCARGIPCGRLPRAWDGRRMYLETGVPLDELALLHARGLFRELTDLSQTAGCLRAFKLRWQAALLSAHSSWKTRWRVTRQTRRMESALRQLYRQHVRPALRMGGELV